MMPVSCILIDFGSFWRFDYVVLNELKHVYIR
jgi:hypothetical protein